MAKSETKFAPNQIVKVKGRAALAKITYPMTIPVPTITDNQFVMIDRIMYKFINGKETFYAWEEDLRLK
jgi:hypothetical protein